MIRRWLQWFFRSRCHWVGHLVVFDGFDGVWIRGYCKTCRKRGSYDTEFGFLED